MDTNPTEMKTLTGLLRDIKEEAYQEMCSLLGQRKEEIVIILLSWLWESVIEHAKRVRPIILSSVACLAPQHCSTLPCTFSEKRN